MIAWQREADAASFEDWSQWETLVYPPYGCQLLRSRKFWVDVPPNVTVCRLVERVPGASRVPRSLSPGSYYIPAENWRELRAMLPAIRAAIAARRRA
jgi:hypothetical protein